jgi:hypothetical protein
MLDAAAVDRTSWLALYGFGYAFLPLLGGIIMFAAGVKNAVIQWGEPLTASTAWFLAAGVATYLVGLAWFRPLLASAPPARAWRWPPPYCPTSGSRRYVRLSRRAIVATSTLDDAPSLALMLAT